MAKTVKKETKTPKPLKETRKKNTIIEDEPVLVNEKNEIIYNPDAVLNEIMEPFRENFTNSIIDDEIKDSIDYLKNNNIVPTNISSDICSTEKYVETKINELNEIKIKLETTNKKNFFPFSDFWNGVTL